MKTGTTSTGFRYEFDEQNANDMRFVDLIAMISAEATPDFEKISGLSRLLEMLLGREQKAALYEHIGLSHEGRVPPAELELALAEILQGGGDAVKN
jgi:hypothetical protein